MELEDALVGHDRRRQERPGRSELRPLSLWGRVNVDAQGRQEQRLGAVADRVLNRLVNGEPLAPEVDELFVVTRERTA